MNDERILVEAEPLNTNLFKIKGRGVPQVASYLEYKGFQAELGVATNGFDWVLIRYDNKSIACKAIEHIDLRPFFSSRIGQSRLEDQTEMLQKFYSNFAEENILAAADEFGSQLEDAKEKITAKFYEHYIQYVFGYDKKANQQVRCLLTSLRVPENTNDQNMRLFVITLMSRLIFIKFLEDKGLIRPSFLDLLKTHKNSNVPTSFYRTYLQPLFYDVFNTPKHSRKPNIIAISLFNTVPYLNGGLFREVVVDEERYDVDNDILEKLIRDILENYLFTLDDPDIDSKSLNPDILGLVFEKTINYLTGEGNDRRKDIGAYYTPDDVTAYIPTETIRNKIFAIIKEHLSVIEGWKRPDIDQYGSLEDFLKDPPTNPKTVRRIYERIKKVTVLDPACGSGHTIQ